MINSQEPRDLRCKLLAFALKHGLNARDAEDAVQDALTETVQRLSDVGNPQAYAFKVLKRRIAAYRRRRGTDAALVRSWAGSRVELPTTIDVHDLTDTRAVPGAFTLLTPQQRRIFAAIYDGYKAGEIAEILGIPASTVRSHLCQSRKTLKMYGEDDERRIMRVAERIYEAGLRGEKLPLGPRPVIGWGWERARALGVDPERGSVGEQLDRDEIARRRRESPFAVHPSALDVLADLAGRAEHMFVVVDAEGFVIWRGGSRRVLRAADRVGFSDGYPWTLRHAGANGVGLALEVGTIVTVCGFEHFVQTQHRMSCVAAPVRDPRTGRVLGAINLTGVEPTIHRALVREIDVLATRLTLAQTG